MNEKESSRKKRERRRENEKKQREIIRMQLHMTAPTEIGLEQAGPNGEGAMFALKAVDKSGALDRIAKGKMGLISEADSRRDHDSGIGTEETDEESDPEEDQLDRDLDSMYMQYQDRKSDSDAKFRAKKARKEHEDGEWEGFEAERERSDDGSQLEDDSSDESADETTSIPTKSLLTDLEGNDKKTGGLSRQAARFFDQDVFKDIGIDEEDLGIVSGDDESGIDTGLDELDKLGAINHSHQRTQSSHDDESEGFLSENEEPGSDDTDNENGFEVVKRTSREAQWEDKAEPRKDGRLGK